MDWTERYGYMRTESKSKISKGTQRKSAASTRALPSKKSTSSKLPERDPRAVTASVQERVESIIKSINEKATSDCQRASIPPAEVKRCIEEAARLGWEDVSEKYSHDYSLDNLNIMLLLFKREDLHWTFTQRIRLKPFRRSWVNARYIWDLQDANGRLQGVAIDEALTASGMIAKSFEFYTSKPIQTLLGQIDDIANEVTGIREGMVDGLAGGDGDEEETTL